MIKAERSDLARERSRRADFNHGRRFDLIDRLYRFDLRGKRILIAAKRRRASQTGGWNTRSVARRQLTIATRKRAFLFGAAPVIDRGTELRAQERKELLRPERFLQHGASRMPDGDTRNAVPRREKEGTSTRGENVGDRIDLL